MTCSAWNGVLSAPTRWGLRLEEANGLVSAVQEAMVDEQVNAALAAQAACPHCGEAHRHKDTRKIVVRSLYGTLPPAKSPLVALYLQAA